MHKTPEISPSADSLNPRQQQVLTAIVDHFIVKAEPISSRILSLSPIFRMSPATLRNTMAELTDRGFVEQPHTSAGRQPTTKGYRTYVDELMGPAELPEAMQQAFEKSLEGRVDIQEILAETAASLGRITGLLGITVTPDMQQGRFRHLNLVPLEEGRVLVVLHASDMVFRTVLVEPSAPTSIFRLEGLAKRINAEMQGRPVSDLNEFLRITQDESRSQEETKALDFFHRSISKLLEMGSQQDIQLAGTPNLLRQRDFVKSEAVESVLELLESRMTLVHFLRQRASIEGVHVTIGEEQKDGKPFRHVSIVTASVTIGGTQAVLGVMGPRRMPYNQLIALVGYAAKTLDAKVNLR